MSRRLAAIVPVVLVLAAGLAGCSSDERPADDLLRPQPGAARPAAGAVQRGDGHRHRRPLRPVRQPRPAHRRGGRAVAGRRLHLAEPGRGGLPRRARRAGRRCPRTCSTWCPSPAGPATAAGSGCRPGTARWSTTATWCPRTSCPSRCSTWSDPQYEGQVAVAPENGSFQDFVTSMRTELGDDETQAWLEGMAENDSPVYADNLSIVDAVARGVVRFGLVNHYYNYRILDEDPEASSRNHFFSAERHRFAAARDRRQHPRDGRHARRGPGAHRVPAVRGGADASSPTRPSSTRWSTGWRRPTSCPSRRRCGRSTSTLCRAAWSAPPS